MNERESHRVAPGARTDRAQRRVLIYFALGLIALDIAVVARGDLWEQYAVDEYRERLNACNEARRCDAIVVGGSPVSEGFDPNGLRGLRWRGQPLQRPYNLGLPGATASEVWHVVKNGVRVPPRLIVYGITATDLNDSRDEAHGPRSLMTTRDVAAWIYSRPTSAEWVVRQFFWGRLARLWNLFYYRNGIRLWAAAAAEQRWSGVAPQLAAEAQHNLWYTGALRSIHGFAPRPNFQEGRLDQLKAAGLVPAVHFLEHYEIHGGHLSYVARVLDWARERGVDVVFIDMPMSYDLEIAKYPQAFTLYRRTVHDLARSRGVPFLRATREAVRLSDGDFSDMVHLNRRGSARLANWVRQNVRATP